MLGKTTIVSSLKIVALIVALTGFYCTLNAQTLKADYQFQGDLNSSVAGAPAMSNIGGGNTFAVDRVDGYTRQTLRFPANQGLSVNTTGLIPTNAFTVVILFRFDNVTGVRRRVLDPKQGLSDPCGLYIADSKLEPESTAVTDIYPSTYIQVAITREAGGAIRFARDGYLFNLTDSSNCYVNDGNNLRFFADDSVVGNEASAGNVARIRLYDGSMTGAQMRALDRPANATGGGDQAILFSTTRHNAHEIYSMNSDGSNERRLTNNTALDYGARWSPDKSKIVFVRDEAGAVPEQVWIMNADGSGQTRLTNTSTFDHAPSFKPDGSKIVFSRCNATTFLCDIYTMNPDGTNQQPFNGATTPELDEDRASYSPDGSRFVYSRINPDPGIPVSGLYSLTETTILTRLTDPILPIGDLDARYSPDGSKIAYVRSPDLLGTNPNIDLFEVYIMNADGTNEVNITNNNIFEGSPMWTQDSTTIAFDGRRDTAEVREIYTMTAVQGGTVVRLTFNSVTDVLSDFYTIPNPVTPSVSPFDYDGDGKSDPSVFRASNGTWYVSRSGLGDMYVMPWGLNGDNIVPADYDGDGKTDLAVRRPADNNFYIFNSSNSTMEVRNFGIAGDIALPSDYNGDGKADVAVWRPSNGTWYLSLSGSGIFYVMPWGLAADKPVPGDYDGDGKTDLAVFRPTEGRWYMFNTVTGAFSTNDFGVNGDTPVQADYSGDGKTDFAVYRASNNTWYRQHTNDGTFNVSQWGLAGDFPTPGDFDGDGRTDVAVWRPSDGTWYVLKSTSGVFTQSFGTSGDTPTPNAFVY